MCFRFPESLSRDNCTVLAPDALFMDHEVSPVCHNFAAVKQKHVKYRIMGEHLFIMFTKLLTTNKSRYLLSRATAVSAECW